MHVLEQKICDYEGNQADRVDKSLVKNLFIGYCVAPPNDKSQILKLISTVLDFNKSESDKVGLNKHQASWLSSVFQADSNRNGMYNPLSFSTTFFYYLAVFKRVCFKYLQRVTIKRVSPWLL